MFVVSHLLCIGSYIYIYIYICYMTKKRVCVSGKEEAAAATLETTAKNTKEAETLGNIKTI